MQLDALRKKHPTFRYRSYSISGLTGNISVRFDFLLEPDIAFHPEIVLPFSRMPRAEVIDLLAFNLGLVEMLSYWKAACSPQIVIEAGALSPEQCAWWKDLLLNGLSEFFFRNRIDSRSDDFVTISARGDKPAPPFLLETEDADLLLVGGGKDSTVTLELLSDLEKRKAALILNPTRASLDSARIAGYTNPIVVKRTIDPKLLELNEIGYLNGHTPFSAYLAFTGLLSASLNGYRRVIASNERSANEPNTKYLDREVNHQYSKAYRFEARFREYCEEYLTPSLEYFSFLRPLYDLQITKLFSQFSRHFFSFRSCNVAQKQDAWCGTCPKCAFVYLSLVPFLSEETIREIIGKELLASPAAQEHILSLTGLSGMKPFECVGTADEAQLAVYLAAQRAEAKKEELPAFLSSVDKRLRARNGKEYADDQLLYSFGSEHFLPDLYEEILRAAGDAQ